ncbi:hypothetical protein [Acinetobacter towneri]|uniref:hypothetical protein n=1 Tax=Acinetobacter TaxID=469 RepID=UPI001CE06C4E|nr:hypothetical protein [Acinetobacter towneri]
MKDQNDDKTVDWVGGRACSSFEKRMDILIFAVHAKREITVTDIAQCVLSCSRMTIRNCLKDLVCSGYMAKTSIYTYTATNKTKELFGVGAE